MNGKSVGVGEASIKHGQVTGKLTNLEDLKRTGLDLIPGDWALRRLREISPRQSVGLVINPSTYFDRQGSVPMLVGSNVYENHIDWSSAKTITKESNDKLPASQLFPGDLVMVRVGDPGVTAVIPPDQEAANCASMMIVRGSQTFNSDWLCYLMNSDYGRTQVKNVQYGTAQKQFNISDAVDFIYPVPPVIEQHAIATALSDVDALLEELDNLIAKKRDIKQATMQQLLTGQTRLPGFTGEWGVKQLGDLAQLKNGYAFQSSTYTELGRFKVITIANVQDEYMTVSECNKVAYLPKDVQPHQRLDRNDILISLTGNVGRVCRVIEDDCLLNQRVGKLVPTGVDDEFLFAILTQRNFLLSMGKKAKGGAQGNLAISDITEFDFLLPFDRNEQRAIATVLADMGTEIVTLKTSRDKICTIKQAMMQQLLTGRTRLI